ncbi:hypothetical protein [Corynebacterium casei]|uniref:hypothetical protein n=1 Tax=Corynebacterium casei TaxID=160386 RepID=UPI003FD0951D
MRVLRVKATVSAAATMSTRLGTSVNTCRDFWTYDNSASYGDSDNTEWLAIGAG